MLQTTQQPASDTKKFAAATHQFNTCVNAFSIGSLQTAPNFNDKTPVMLKSHEMSAKQVNKSMRKSISEKTVKLRVDGSS